MKKSEKETVLNHEQEYEKKNIRRIRTALVITDLDETALRSDGTCSSRTIEAFKACRRAGIRTAVATARTAVSAARQASILGTEYAICANGSRILKDGKAIWGDAMSQGLMNRLIRELKSLETLQDITVETGDSIFHNRRNLPPGHIYHHAAVFYDFTEEIRQDAFQILTGIESEEEARQLVDRFPECACIHYRGTTRYAFVKKGTGKAQTIKKLAKCLGITLKEIVAFGDDYGDMEMLRLCGCGVAMGNGPSEVKQAARFVTSSNDEDGVAEFIESAILI